MMIRAQVNSTNLSEVGYDVPTKTLEILFVSGGVYCYFDVPEKTFQDLMASASKGKYFQSMIKDRYRCAKL